MLFFLKKANFFHAIEIKMKAKTIKLALILKLEMIKCLLPPDHTLLSIFEAIHNKPSKYGRNEIRQKTSNHLVETLAHSLQLTRV